MNRHHITRRTIRLYAVFASVTAALGIGVALGADPWPGHDQATAATQSPVGTPRQAQPAPPDPGPAAYVDASDAQPVIRTGAS